MSISTESPRGARKARTYLPESRDELLDFADFMRKLEAFLSQGSSKAALVDPQGNPRPIPDEIFRILDQVTNALAAGEGITVLSQGMLLTTQQAADFLGVSRPTLVRLLEDGVIAHEKPGRHRRVPLQDLMNYQSASRSERRSKLRELQQDTLRSRIQVGNPVEVKRSAELDS